MDRRMLVCLWPLLAVAAASTCANVNKLDTANGAGGLTLACIFAHHYEFASAGQRALAFKPCENAPIVDTSNGNKEVARSDAARATLQAGFASIQYVGVNASFPGCAKSSVLVVAVCDKAEQAGKLVALPRTTDCTTTLVLSMASVCTCGTAPAGSSAATPLVTSDGGGSTPAAGGGAHNSSGSGFFATLFYVLLASAALYLVCGVAYNRYVMGARGAHQLPNYFFWLSCCTSAKDLLDAALYESPVGGGRARRRRASDINSGDIVRPNAAGGGGGGERLAAANAFQVDEPALRVPTDAGDGRPQRTAAAHDSEDEKLLNV